MDPSSSTAAAHSSRGPRIAEKEKEDRHKAQSHRSTRYKEKYQQMKEKYDQATMIRDKHQRDLEVANAKMKKLQAENELLIDAMLLADRGLLERYFPSAEGHDVLPPINIIPADLPLPRSTPLLATSHDPRDPNATPRLGYRSPYSNSIPHANTNGNSMMHSNGIRRRPAEPPMEQHYIVDQPLEFLPPEINGRS